MPTKSREVKMILQNKGFERGVNLLLQELFERQAAVEQMMNDTNAMQLQIMNIVTKVVDGAGEMRNRIETMQKAGQEADDAGVGTAHGD